VAGIGVDGVRNSKTGAADEGIIEMGFRDEEWCGSGGGRRRRGRLWWREEKLETRSRKVEVRKVKLESESGWSDGEAESGDAFTDEDGKQRRELYGFCGAPTVLSIVASILYPALTAGLIFGAPTAPGGSVCSVCWAFAVENEQGKAIISALMENG